MIKMKWMLLNTTLLCRKPADEGAAGGDGEGSGAGEGQGEGDGEGGATSWLDGIEGLEDADRAFVGERSPKDLISYAKQQRQAASARADEVAKADGMFKMPEPDANAEAWGEHFSRYRPEDTEQYKSIAGYKDGEMSAAQQIEVDAAHAAGVHPEQYRLQVAAREKLQADADKANSDKLVASLQDEWGADMQLNSQLVDRAIKGLNLGEGFVNAVSAPHAGFTAADHKSLMDGLLTIGKQLQEGGPVDTGSETNGGAMSATDEREGLIQMQIEGRTLSPTQVSRMKVLNEKIAEEKANAVS